MFQRFLTAVLCATLLALPLSGQENESTVFQITLDGDQAVPPVTTPHSGVGMVYLDPVAGTLDYEIEITGLLGAFTRMILVSGEVAAASVPLFHGEGGPTHFEGTIGPLDAATLALLQSGELGFTVSSSPHPSGELRGQITPARNAMIVYLAGHKLGAGTGSTGTGTIELDLDQAGTLTCVGELTGLTASAVMLHEGVPGGGGSVVATLDVDGAGVVSGTTPLGALQRAMVRSGRYAVTVETAAFPGGEIGGTVVNRVMPYGVGCAGPTGPVTLSIPGHPTPGGTVQGVLVGGSPFVPIVIFRSLVGGEMTLKGCPLHVLPPIPELVIGLTLDANGEMHIPKTLPLDLITPCRVHIQIFGIDPAAANGELWSSNGIVVDIQD